MASDNPTYPMDACPTYSPRTGPCNLIEGHPGECRYAPLVDGHFGQHDSDCDGCNQWRDACRVSDTKPYDAGKLASAGMRSHLQNMTDRAFDCMQNEVARERERRAPAVEPEQPTCHPCNCKVDGSYDGCTGLCRVPLRSKTTGPIDSYSGKAIRNIVEYNREQETTTTIAVARACPEHADSPAEHPSCRACAYFEGFRAAEVLLGRVIDKHIGYWQTRPDGFAAFNALNDLMDEVLPDDE